MKITFHKGAPGAWHFDIEGVRFLAIRNIAGFAHRDWDLYNSDGTVVLSDQLATRQECYAEALKAHARSKATQQWLDETEGGKR